MDWYCENVIHGDLDIEKVYESDTVIAFHHTKPFWEHHIVAVPKEHIVSMASSGARNAELMAEMMDLMSKLAEEFEEKSGGCHRNNMLFRHCYDVMFPKWFRMMKGYYRVAFINLFYIEIAVYDVFAIPIHAIILLPKSGAI